MASFKVGVQIPSILITSTPYWNKYVYKTPYLPPCHPVRLLQTLEGYGAGPRLHVILVYF